MLDSLWFCFWDFFNQPEIQSYQFVRLLVRFELKVYALRFRFYLLVARISLAPELTSLLIAWSFDVKVLGSIPSGVSHSTVVARWTAGQLSD